MTEKTTHKFTHEQIKYAMDAYKECDSMSIPLFMRKFKLCHNGAFHLYKKAFLIIWEVDND